MINERELTHQLRNLTQVVSGNLELLASRTNDAFCLRFIRNAQAATLEISTVTELIADTDDAENHLPERATVP